MTEQGQIIPEKGQIWRHRVTNEHLLIRVSQFQPGIADIVIACFTDPVRRAAPHGNGFCATDWIIDNFQYVRSLRD